MAGKVTPQLRCFDDGWSALWGFKDMLEFMATVDGDDISADDLSKAMVALEIEDMTQESYEG